MLQALMLKVSLLAFIGCAQLDARDQRDYRIRGTMSQAISVITAKAVRVSRRVSHISRRTPTRVHSMRAPACFWSSSARLEYLRITAEPWHATCGGYNDWKCMRDAFVVLSFLSVFYYYSPSLSRRLARLEIDFGLEWLERHRARRLQLSW